MSDVGKPRGPAASDDLLRPDAGFHDDKVGGQLKSEEAARRRAAQARLAARPKHIDQEPQKVAAAASFRRSAREEDPVSAEAKRHQRALVAGQPTPRRDAKAKPGATSSGEAARLAARVNTLFGAMVALEQDVGDRLSGRQQAAQARGGQKVQAISEDDAQSEQHPPPPSEDAFPVAGGRDNKPTAARPSADTDVAARLERAQQQARFGVQHLLAGGTGFVLDDDPRVSFGALFAKLACWPARVPPGRTPQSPADFDAFFAWVFMPEAPAEPIEPIEPIEPHG